MSDMFGSREFLKNNYLNRFAGAVLGIYGNAKQEAMYPVYQVDADGQKLDASKNRYTLRFAKDQLPPVHAFWSLTMGNAQNRFVPNPINRYSVGDRTGLVPNADGSVDIYMQKAAPADHAANWLPAPSGKFTLWLRVYVPGAAILDGKYTVPPVVEVK